MLATYGVEIAFFREAYTSESSGRIKKTVSFVRRISILSATPATVS
jgi:hypothetical protein